MLSITFNNFTTNRKYGASFFKEIVGTAVEESGAGADKIELSVNLTGEGRIKALNKKYRGKNKITDVLSFPLQDRISLKSTQDGIISLGDIFICLPIAKKYATRESVSLEFKLAFLTIHGFLHLLGYDHEKSKEGQQKMSALQDKILNKINF